MKPTSPPPLGDLRMKSDEFDKMMRRALSVSPDPQPEKSGARASKEPKKTPRSTKPKK